MVARQIARPEPKRGCRGRTRRNGHLRVPVLFVGREGWHDVRLLVFGGRLYTDPVAVWRILDAIHRKHGLTCIIDGACPTGGADLLAHEWAAEHNVVSERYPVNHVTDGQWPGAGF